MSTPSTALDGIAARPAPAPALKIVPARHPLQVFGTVLALALILIGLQSVLGNRAGAGAPSPSGSSHARCWKAWAVRCC
jgi:hypothetical protein